MTLDEINTLDHQEFVRRLGGVFEHSQWVADTAWQRRPFASVGDLHSAMVDAVDQAGRDRKLALLRAHPQLAGKAMATGTLTEDSTREQSGAGLTQCTPEQLARLQAMNREYEDKFGFPFIVAVRGL